MTDRDPYQKAEPVPPATQLAVLPFLAAVDGYLRENGDVPGLRITMHRTFTRVGEKFLQQVCAYLKGEGGEWSNIVGRTFAADDGIMGAAFGNGQVWRTRRLASAADLAKKLGEQDSDPEKPRSRSWLAVPFLGPRDAANGADKVVLILFADCYELNFFADEDRVRRVVAMGRGFCRLFDWLQEAPFENLRNFPLEEGTPVTGKGGVFPVQEPLPDLEPPRFTSIRSFNYEASAA